MFAIYLSSTYRDLRDYRTAVYHALRQLRQDVIAMEDYGATDARPLTKCLADVAACDLDLGVFAWRYGSVPVEDNPHHRSITESEDRQASALKQPRYIYVLAEDAP